MFSEVAVLPKAVEVIVDCQPPAYERLQRMEGRGVRTRQIEYLSKQSLPIFASK